MGGRADTRRPTSAHDLIRAGRSRRRAAGVAHPAAMPASGSVTQGDRGATGDPTGPGASGCLPDPARARRLLDHSARRTPGVRSGCRVLPRHRGILLGAHLLPAPEGRAARSCGPCRPGTHGVCRPTTASAERAGRPATLALGHHRRRDRARPGRKRHGPDVRRARTGVPAWTHGRCVAAASALCATDAARPRAGSQCGCSGGCHRRCLRAGGRDDGRAPKPRLAGSPPSVSPSRLPGRNGTRLMMPVVLTPLRGDIHRAEVGGGVSRRCWTWGGRVGGTRGHRCRGRGA